MREVASYLQDSNKRVIIAGFCDERGTAEYNRALGEKRAESVRDSLIAAGVAPERVQTVSFGSEMPVDPSSNESAWARNRRAGVRHHTLKQDLNGFLRVPAPCRIFCV